MIACMFATPVLPAAATLRVLIVAFLIIPNVRVFLRIIELDVTYVVSTMETIL